MTRPPKRKRLSPQERKAMSLRKDRRSDAFEYETKGWRSKLRAASHRRARREDETALLSDPEVAEGRFRLKQRRRWKKVAGVTLGADVATKRETRVVRHRARKRRHAEAAAARRCTDED